MKHSVRTYNASGKCLYEANFKTADEAYEEYVKDIRLLEIFLNKGEKVTIVRFNDGSPMTVETVVGTN